MEIADIKNKPKKLIKDFHEKVMKHKLDRKNMNNKKDTNDQKKKMILVYQLNLYGILINIKNKKKAIILLSLFKSFLVRRNCLFIKYSTPIKLNNKHAIPI